MDEHQSALLVLARALACGLGAGRREEAAQAVDAPTAAAVNPDEVEVALAHLAGCQDCSSLIDLAETLALMEGGHETPAMTSAPVDPGALFESALTAALTDPDELVRLRAAERLGSLARPAPAAEPQPASAPSPGAPAINALVTAAAEDASRRVRAAALTALEKLDPQVSLPAWVIDLWSETPAEAAPYLEDVRARLAPRAEAEGDSVIGDASDRSDANHPA